MSEEKSSYQQIFKATSIFGGVQLINIVIAILRSKFVAILLGPAGMGTVALFTSTLNLVTGITSFGLNRSAVKNVAVAYGSGDHERLGKIVSVFRRLVWITGSLGFIVTLVFSPLLSEMAFNNKTQTLAFAILSITLLVSQISTGQTVILQGMRKIQFMARASVLGALAGLLTSIPLYYFFKEEGIVPALIITSLSTLGLSWYFSNKVDIPYFPVDKSIVQTEGKEMLRMGFLLSLSSLIAMGASYGIRIFISNTGGIKDVGLYTAGFSIIGTYVGMVFTAMSTDYYPRLAALTHDNSKSNAAINQQSEIAVLILAPILMILLVFVKLGVIILYSKDFLGAIDMIHWATLGVFFKSLGWAISILFLAKSSTKAYFWSELIANIYMLGFNIMGYYYFGLTGLGISFLLAYLVYFIQVYLIAKKLYHFRISKSLLMIFSIQFMLAVGCFIIVYLLNEIAAYCLGTLLVFLSSYYSWIHLDKKIGIKALIPNRLKK